MSILRSLSFALSLLAPTCAFAQSTGPILRFQPPVGNFYRLTYSDVGRELQYPPSLPTGSLPRPEGFSIQNITEKEIGLDWRIESRDPKGNTRIAMSYAYISVNIIKGQRIDDRSGEVIGIDLPMSFDTRVDVNPVDLGVKRYLESSDKKYAAELSQRLELLQFARDALREAVIGKSFTVTVSPEANVLSVSGIDVIMDDYRTAISRKKVDPTMRALQDATLESFFGDTQIKRTLSDSVLLALPNHAVKVAETWSDKMDAIHLGYTVPVTRTFRITGISRDAKEIKISGTREMSLAGTKDGIAVKDKGIYEFSAVVDTATGIAMSISMSGKEEGFIYPGNATESRFVGFINGKYTGKYGVELLGKLAHGRTDRWEVDGGNGWFTITVGAGWARMHGAATIAGITSIGFDNPLTDQVITATFRLVPESDRTSRPISKRSETIMQAYDYYGAPKAKLISFRQFQARGLNWARTNYMVTEEDGSSRTHWNEFTYTADREYSFEASYSGTPNVDSDQEIVQILDSISIPQPRYSLSSKISLASAPASQNIPFMPPVFASCVPSSTVGKKADVGTFPPAFFRVRFRVLSRG